MGVRFAVLVACWMVPALAQAEAGEDVSGGRGAAVAEAFIAPTGTPRERAQAQARALVAAEAAYGAGSAEVARLLPALAQAQHEAGESEALQTAERAVAAVEKLRPHDLRLEAQARHVLGNILQIRHRFDDAEAQLTGAWQAYVKLDGPQTPKALDAFADRAAMKIQKGDLPGATEDLETVVAAEDAVLAAGHPDRIDHKVKLGNAYTYGHRPRDAERVLREAAEEARVLLETHPTRTMALQALGAELWVQGRLSEAADLFGQAIDLRRQAKGGRPEELADTLASLAYVHLAMERPEAAEPLFLEAETLFAEGGVIASSAASLLGAGQAAVQLGQPQLAFERRRKALDVVLAQPNPHPLAVTMFKFKLADSYADTGDLATAETMEAEALEALRKVRPEGHFQPLNAAITLGWIQAQAGRPEEGLAKVRPAVARTLLEARRLEIGRAKTTGVQENLEVLGKAMHAAWIGRDAELGFLLAQTLIESDAGRAAAADEARLAAQSGRLAETLRRRQALYAEGLSLDAEYLKTLGGGDAAAVEALKTRIAAVEAEAALAQKVLDAEFPEHAALIRPTPIAIAKAQARLEDGEVLIVPVATDRGLYTFALTSGAMAWDRVALSRRQTRALVGRLRQSAEPANGVLAPFDRATAFEIHQAIFTPKIRALSDQATTYTFAPDPIFSPLPFAALVTEVPTGDDADPRSLSRTRWLIRDAAIQVAPSIPAMRAVADREGHGLTFFGVGAPALAGEGAVRRAASYYRSGAADPAAVRSLPPLPSAQRELETMARALGRSNAQVLVGEAATEAAVKTADLSQADVIAFATHGLLAGELDQLSEPALVFTPPQLPSVDDDALLTASEAARLKLNARWIILSACNTAAGDAREAPGYAGLARAFMFAGAQTVLVSHWPVRDDAAARLTVDAVRHAARGGSPAEGLRRAALRLMADRQTPDAAAPAVWAPFILVGR